MSLTLPALPSVQLGITNDGIGVLVMWLSRVWATAVCLFLIQVLVSVFVLVVIFCCWWVSAWPAVLFLAINFLSTPSSHDSSTPLSATNLKFFTTTTTTTTAVLAVCRQALRPSQVPQRALLLSHVLSFRAFRVYAIGRAGILYVGPRPDALGFSVYLRGLLLACFPFF